MALWSSPELSTTSWGRGKGNQSLADGEGDFSRWSPPAKSLSGDHPLCRIIWGLSYRMRFGENKFILKANRPLEGKSKSMRSSPAFLAHRELQGHGGNDPKYELRILSSISFPLRKSNKCGHDLSPVYAACVCSCGISPGQIQIKNPLISTGSWSSAGVQTCWEGYKQPFPRE